MLSGHESPEEMMDTIEGNIVELAEGLVTENEDLRARLAAAEAERDAYRAKWESVPLIQMADVVDHFRLLTDDNVAGRVAMVIGFLMDHTDWSPAKDTDNWRKWHQRMHRPYKRYAPESPHADA